MTFTYTDAPGVVDIDTIRFLVGDTIEHEYFLENEEINFLMSQWESKGSLYYTASKAAESIATKLTREVAINADGQSLDLSSLRDRYMLLAEELRGQYEDALVGGSSLYAGGMDAHESPDPSVKPLSFGTGMGDNPWAGNQDYGDTDSMRSAQRRVQWGEEVP